MRNLKKNSKKGSVLVFTMLIMFITFAVVTGIAFSSAIETRSARSTKNSAAAFQVADSGIEVVSVKVKDMDLLKTLDDVCDDGASLGSCESGSCKGKAGGFEVFFYDTGGDALHCDDAIDNIASIKSVGTYAGATRAVQINLGE